MRSNAWTTAEEYAFLEGQIPQFAIQQEIRFVGPWLAGVAATFLTKFPSRSAQFDRESLTNKLRTWFGNHTRDSVKGTDNRHVLDLTGKANRRPLPLQSSQAYSALYYREGSPLYREIKELHAKYKSGDATTISSLKNLFEGPPDDDEPDGATPSSPSNPQLHPSGTPAPPKTTRRRRGKAADVATPQPEDPPVPTKPARGKRGSKRSAAGADDTHYTPPFIHFQQTMIREKLKTISDEEAAAVERHIEETYSNAMKVWERPWLGFVKPGKSEDKLESEYYEKNANRVSHSLQIASEEVTRQSLFKTFFLWGGPASIPGTVDMFYTQTGCTTDGELDFTTFLGPMFDELQEKYRQWLQLTYTKDELHRKSTARASPQALDESQPPSVPPTTNPTIPSPITVNPGPITVNPSPITVNPSPINPTTTGIGANVITETGPSVVIPAITGPGIIHPIATGHGVVSPATTGPGVVSPATTGPGAVSPATTGPGVVSPATTGPGVVSPATTDPGVASPATTGPSVVSSTVTSPSVVNSATTSPNVISPTPSGLGPSIVNPIATGPSVISPATTGPITSSLGVFSPAMTSSGVVNPATSNPDVVGSTGTISLAVTNSGATNPTAAVPDPGPSPLASSTSLSLAGTTVATPSSFDHFSAGQDESGLTNTTSVKAYPKFITPEVMAHLSSVAGVDGWSELIQAYLEFEDVSPSKSNTRLPAKGRPPEVETWLKSTTNDPVLISDVPAYARAWMDWWVGCQPQGRAAASWPFSHEPLSNTQWGRLLNGGKYGIFLFVMALSWWAKSLGSATSSPEFTGAVADTEWVLRQLTDVLTTQPTPTPTLEVPPEAGRSKRKIVLTEKVLNADESVQKKYRR